MRTNGGSIPIHGTVNRVFEGIECSAAHSDKQSCQKIGSGLGAFGGSALGQGAGVRTQTSRPSAEAQRIVGHALAFRGGQVREQTFLEAVIQLPVRACKAGTRILSKG